MQLKINYLYNLHDARYCASKGIQFLTFFVGKAPNHIKLPLSMIWEIVEWLEGSRICLDTGNDKETFFHLSETIQPHPNLYLQTSAQNFSYDLLTYYPQIFIRSSSPPNQEILNFLSQHPNLFLEIPFSTNLIFNSSPLPNDQIFLVFQTMPEKELINLKRNTNITLEKFLFNEMELNYEELDHFMEILTTN